MHPILLDRQRVALYLIAWLPIASIFTYIVDGSTGSWPEAMLLALPMSLLYAFMCLSAWYVCLAAPMRAHSVARLLGTLASASALTSVVWILLGELWALAIDPWLTRPGLGDRYLQVIAPTFVIGMLLYLLAASVHYLLIAFEEAREEKKRALEMQVLAREAELKALRAQIDPHFLFNSLNSISSLTMADPSGARRMCLLLADFLRSSLMLGAKREIPISDELRLVEGFLDIEKVRYGQRLSVVRNVDPDCNGCLLPPLLIQPLVENAIRHGIARLIEGGTIRIDVQRLDDDVEIVVQNPVDLGGETARSGAGMGLENVKARLAKLFANRASVHIVREENRFEVRLRFPYIQFGDTR